MLVVTLKVPAVIVNTLATPKTLLPANTIVVAFIVTLKSATVPLKREEPVKVAVPAEAENVPLLFNEDAILKFVAVVTVPLIKRP